MSRWTSAGNLSGTVNEYGRRCEPSVACLFMPVSAQVGFEQKYQFNQWHDSGGIANKHASRHRIMRPRCWRSTSRPSHAHQRPAHQRGNVAPAGYPAHRRGTWLWQHQTDGVASATAPHPAAPQPPWGLLEASSHYWPNPVATLWRGRASLAPRPFWASPPWSCQPRQCSGGHRATAECEHVVDRFHGRTGGPSCRHSVSFSHLGTRAGPPNVWPAHHTADQRRCGRLVPWGRHLHLWAIPWLPASRHAPGEVSRPLEHAAAATGSSEAHLEPSCGTERTTRTEKWWWIDWAIRLVFASQPRPCAWFSTALAKRASRQAPPGCGPLSYSWPLQRRSRATNPTRSGVVAGPRNTRPRSCAPWPGSWLWHSDAFGHLLPCRPLLRPRCPRCPCPGPACCGAAASSAFASASCLATGHKSRTCPCANRDEATRHILSPRSPRSLRACVSLGPLPRSLHARWRGPAWRGRNGAA